MPRASEICSRTLPRRDDAASKLTYKHSTNLTVCHGPGSAAQLQRGCKERGLPRDGPMDHRTGKGWVAAKKGDYHKNKNSPPT